MRQHSLRLYSILSRLDRLQSYKGKIMGIAFIGTHVPLLTLLVYFVLSATLTFTATVQILLVALLATLIGTVLVLYILDSLLAPVIVTSLALREYLSHQKLPNLPTEFKDEAGTLMANTALTIKKTDEVIQYIANYDILTGLPKRNLLRDRLQQALLQAQVNRRLLAVFWLGLDSFKTINTTLGQETGDLLLRAVAQRLAGGIREHDILARLDGDEFAIIQTDLTSSAGAIFLAQRLLNILAHPFSLNGQEVHTSASIGITFYPLDYPNPNQVGVDQLLRNADTAMNQVKDIGRGNYQFYAPEMNRQLQERLALENGLYSALEQDEMILHYQPRVDLASGEIVAVEALLRWNSPQLGMISPAKFVPIAEQNGLIIPLGDWVLRSACAQSRAWQQAGLPGIRMSVNLSARQFEQPELAERIAQVLQETRLAADCLELEVTESLIMKDVQQSTIILQQLHAMGIALSLDDFGIGYSSLNYLQRFPVDTLKIDQSFVQDISTDADDAAVVRVIIALADSLQLNITAEGVETQTQLEYLKAHGCDEIQGYYFSGPLPAEAMTQLLRERRNLWRSAV